MSEPRTYRFAPALALMVAAGCAVGLPEVAATEDPARVEAAAATMADSPNPFTTSAFAGVEPAAGHAHHGHHGHHGGGGMDHSKMDHSKMDHSKMDHSKTEAQTTTGARTSTEAPSKTEHASHAEHGGAS